MTPHRAEFVGLGRWGTRPLKPPACVRPPGGCPRNRQPLQPPTRPMRPLPWWRCGVGPPLHDASGGLRSSALSLPPRWPSPRGAGRANWRPPPPAGHHDIPDRVRAVAAPPVPPCRGRVDGGAKPPPGTPTCPGVRSRASKVHVLVDAPLSSVSGERPARHEQEVPVPLQEPTPPPGSSQSVMYLNGARGAPPSWWPPRGSDMVIAAWPRQPRHVQAHNKRPEKHTKRG